MLLKEKVQFSSSNKWSKVVLGDLVKKISIKASPSEFPKAKFIGMDCIEPNTLLPSFLYDFSEFKSAGNQFKSNNVLYGRMRPYLNKVYRAKFDGVCSGEFIVLECSEKIKPDLLAYILHSREFVRFANEKTSGDRPRITFEEIIDYPINLPPISKQDEIVSKIEEMFSEIEKGIESLKLAQQQLKVYRQAVLKRAFEGLTQFPFEEFVESSQNGLSKRKGTKGLPYKVLRLADISNNKIDNQNPRNILMDKPEINKYKIKEDDLICIRVNGSKDLVGKLVYVSRKDENDNWAFCDHFIRFKLKSETTISKFYHYYYSTLKARKYVQDNMVTSAGQNTVSQVTIKNLMVPYADLKTQQLVVHEIESKFTVVDKMEESINQSLEQAEAMRQSVLKKAFEGKIN